jgi:hypothetical protein
MNFQKVPIFAESTIIFLEIKTFSNSKNETFKRKYYLYTFLKFDFLKELNLKNALIEFLIENCNFKHFYGSMNTKCKKIKKFPNN